jgi:hypothetical protein
MKSLLAFCLTLIVSQSLYAQIPQDTILCERQKISDLSYYIIYDKIWYEWHKKPKEYILYKDTLQLPIALPDINIRTYHFDNYNQKLYVEKRYYGYENDYSYFIFDFKNDNFKTEVLSKDASDIVMADNKLYYSQYSQYFQYSKLYIQDMATQNITDSVDMDNSLLYHMTFQIIKFSNTNNVFIGYGDPDGGEIADEQYYEYDEISKDVTLSKNNDMIKKTIDPNSFIIRFYDFSGKYLFLDKYIMDSGYNFFSKINEIYADVYGFVIAEGEMKQLILKSNLDKVENEKEQRYVLIPFIPNPFKEKAMYQIYENIELKKSDLQQFDAFDLRILRNMVFAKHNYAFKDKFLQAYFNLYSFYSSYGYDKNRLADVTDLLTSIDKKNLELIQQMSKEKER